MQVEGETKNVEIIISWINVVKKNTVLVHGSWLIMQKQEIRSISANENIKSFQMESGLTGLRPWQSLLWVPAPKKVRSLLLLLQWGFLLLFSLDINNITMDFLKVVNNIQKSSLLIFLTQNYLRKSSSDILTTAVFLLSHKIWHLLMMWHFIVKNLTQTKICYQYVFQKNIKFVKPILFVLNATCDKMLRSCN